MKNAKTEKRKNIEKENLGKDRINFRARENDRYPEVGHFPCSIHTPIRVCVCLSVMSLFVDFRRASDRTNSISCRMHSKVESRKFKSRTFSLARNHFIPIPIKLCYLNIELFIVLILKLIVFNLFLIAEIL